MNSKVNQVNATLAEMPLSQIPAPGTKERYWLDLLDRLSERDIQEFRRLILSLHAKNAPPAELSSNVTVLRSQAHTRGKDRPPEPVYQYRRDWLTFYIYYLADGKRSVIEEMLRYGKSYLAQCLDPNYYNGRSIGDRTARTLEMRLNRPAKSMDAPFFPYWDTAQLTLGPDISHEQRAWLSLLPGLSPAQEREMTIMIHARRQNNLDLMQRYGFFAAPSRPLASQATTALDPFSNRRAWLRCLIDKHANGKNRAFADLVGLSSTIPSQYLSTTYRGGQGLSDKATRRIEEKLNLPTGFMDTPFSANRATADKTDGNYTVANRISQKVQKTPQGCRRSSDK